MTNYNEGFYRKNLQEYANPEEYDLENAWGKDDDFYLEIAKNCKGNILDIGCGTGRLARAISKLGKSTVGIDISSEMLDRAKSLSTKLDIEWLELDCRNFELRRKFDLILMTSHGFQHLLTNKDQQDLLNTVKRHLKREGLFVFDTRNLNNRSYGKNVKSELKRSITNEKHQVIQIYLSSRYDEVTKLDHVRIKRVNKNSGNERLSEIYLRYTDRKTLNNILKDHGFEILNQYGNWAKGNFNARSQEIITMCKKISINNKI